jgi:hypothetical protein
MPLDAKKPFNTSPEGPSDRRVAHAADHAVYLLDRIEDHLGRIANALHLGGGNESLRRELTTMNSTLRSVATKIRA